MTEKTELCEHGKPYPCDTCPDPCTEELKRREFYDENQEDEPEDEGYSDDDEEDL